MNAAIKRKLAGYIEFVVGGRQGRFDALDLVPEIREMLAFPDRGEEHKAKKAGQS